MNKLLLVVVSFLVITCLMVACDKDEWKDEVASKISTGLAPIIAEVYGCANNAAIKKSFYDVLIVSKLLKPDTTKNKGIGNTLCTELVSYGLPRIIKADPIKPLPEAWECTGEASSNPFRHIGKVVCSVLPI